MAAVSLRAGASQVTVVVEVATAATTVVVATVVPTVATVAATESRWQVFSCTIKCFLL